MAFFRKLAPFNGAPFVPSSVLARLGDWTLYEKSDSWHLSMRARQYQTELGMLRGDGLRQFSELNPFDQTGEQNAEARRKGARIMVGYIAAFDNWFVSIDGAEDGREYFASKLDVYWREVLHRDRRFDLTRLPPPDRFANVPFERHE